MFCLDFTLPQARLDSPGYFKPPPSCLYFLSVWIVINRLMAVGLAQGRLCTFFVLFLLLLLFEASLGYPR